MEKLLRGLPFDVASTFKKSVQFFQAFVSFQIAETGFAHFDVFLWKIEAYKHHTIDVSPERDF